MQHNRKIYNQGWAFCLFLANIIVKYLIMNCSNNLFNKHKTKSGTGMFCSQRAYKIWADSMNIPDFREQKYQLNKRINPFSLVFAVWHICHRRLLKTVLEKQKLPQCFKLYSVVKLSFIEIFNLSVFKVAWCKFVGSLKICGKERKVNINDL